NVGEGAIDAILEVRARVGKFTSLPQFCTEGDLKAVNRRVGEALIKCGGMNMPMQGGKGAYSRAALLGALDVAMDHGQSRARERESGQSSLFGGSASGGAGS